MDDTEIQETVEAILGKGAKVVDCEKKSSIKEEEILLINGLPVTLEGRDGMAIKQALMTGQVPPCDLLNSILIKAGILRAPVQLETSLSVKTSTITKEEVTVSKGGKVVDERHRETKEDNYYTSATSEIWEPVDILPTTQLPQQCILSNLNSSTSNSDSSIPPKQTRPSNTTSNGTSRNNIYRSDTESSCYDKRKYNSVCTSESSTSSYENDSNDENCGNSPILLKNNHQKNNGYLNSVISRDSGHDLSNSVSAISNTTTTRDPVGFGNTFTPTSVSSLSSLDETDFVTNLSNRFKTCDIVKNNSLSVSPPQQTILPTIFGTVTSDHTPKDGANRRSLPQTPQSSKNFSALYSTSGENGANTNVESISDSELSADNALVYRDGNLISGPLDALILHMVPTNSYYPDRAYLFAFLLSSRLYIKPHELLAKVCALCCTQQQLSENYLITPSDQHALERPPTAFTEGHTDANSLQFTTYLIQLLTEWTETFPYDFRDERVMQHVFNITQKCVHLNSSLRANVSSLLQNLLQRLTTLENYEEFLQKLSTSEQELDPNADITEICPSAATLAQQLTHIELERLSYIGPEEFVQAFAKENPHLETSFKDMKKTRNLESYVQWFNRLSYFVATEVSKYPKKKLRVKVVEYWIETAKECFNIGNFNSLMAIIAGLNMSPISRLKKTWSKIQSGKFSILEHQMDPSSNFSSYRSTLKAAMWRSAGARDERQRIVIPFFSLLVKDLYFLNEGCSNKLPNGHINFEKFWQLAKQVTEFMAWKQVTCPFEKNARVITLLQTSAILSENSLALASFECEPPENNQERERYKSLKSETNNTS